MDLLLVVFAALFLATLCYLPVGLIIRCRAKLSFLRHAAWVCFGAQLLVVLFATLFWGGFVPRFVSEYHLLNLRPFVWVAQTYSMGAAKMAKQLAKNVLMLLPAGLLLPVLFPRLRRLWKTLLVIGVFVLAVETVQYFIGRSADVDDLIMNTLGGAAGYGLFALGNRVFSQKPFWNALLGERGK
ncbi:MAG: VanZ family protein [Eubacteriales bacterium]|nr:VanZ family protein [Eubacteriales bacterium]